MAIGSEQFADKFTTLNVMLLSRCGFESGYKNKLIVFDAHKLINMQQYI